ncbi:MAG: DUF481 domain-containing protein [Planctomycetales bacterium]|nr:DUF481 domain-containing protein [Planctomycetales bacterium]
MKNLQLPEFPPTVVPAALEAAPVAAAQSVVPAAATGPGLEYPPPPLAPPLSQDLQVPSVFDEPQAVVTTGPSWYYPWTWIPLDGWKNSAELGINASAGNAESFSFQTGARFKRKSDFTLFDLRITHNRTQANGIETQNNALMFADFERFLGESRWTYFIKNGLEYDEFKAFDLRYNINSGLGYSFYRTDDLTLAGRFGAGASREFGGPNNAWSPEALFGGDYEHQWTKRNKFIAKIDYYPEWTNFSNFRLISDVAWEYLIDEDGNLSFKIGANDRYDSTPNGRKPNDVNYSALLLYKF